jgi:aspartyl-tRNA(Asn)/glutamyl-tRNA(Gln) amidotransferase subunit B
MNKLVPIIGMEVHVELKTQSKMFCGCPNDPDAKKPNSNICPICLAHPGTLPVPNKKAVEWTVLIGKALGCHIVELSKFDRKHYFYPDLPKGYQISQYDEPIAEHGEIKLDFLLEKNIRDTARIGITRVHLEEDTAKLIHSTDDSTLVDFNRAGVPLVEIVTDPDFKTAQEAKIYCKELQRIMRYLEVSDANMEQGHMRCEANISLQVAGTFEIVDGIVKPLAGNKLNNKVELKNINSFRAVEKAIEYEIKRQTAMIEKGEDWPQQTRGWNENKNESVMQRIKENADDYRYFPEPDIPPFHPQKLEIANLPELPIAKRNRFHQEYGFSYSDARILTETKDWAGFAEGVMSELANWLYDLPEVKGESDEIISQHRNKIARLAGGWLTSKLVGALGERNIDINALKLSPENFAELVALIYTGRVNSTNGLKILNEMLDSGTDLDPTHVMEEKGYGQIRDLTALGKMIDEVITNYPKQVEDYKSGKESILKFLIGMVMKATEGSADPAVVEKLFLERFSE